MKKEKLLIIYLFWSISISAQMQQGYVKTKGRMVNGQHVSGHGLPGATVNIQGGKSVGVKTASGAFSFAVPSKIFTIQSVQKKGYELVDADITRKPNSYSTNPLYLVMETQEQQIEDQLNAQEKISRALQAQLKQALQEIQQLKENNRITEEEYHLQYAKLIEDQQTSQKLIADMAKEYAQMDFDQMDELNRRISDAILNGQLILADSLLRSKGDLKIRIEAIKKALQVEAEEEKELAQRKKNLTIVKEGTKKKLEEIASDCYKFYDCFLLKNLRDSAAFYLELRASLDTTNIVWQRDVGSYISIYTADYNKALDFYNRGLRHAHNDVDIATLYCDIACLYYIQADYPYALILLNKAENILKNSLGEMNPKLITTYHNIGNIYNLQANYSRALEFYMKALDIQKVSLNPIHPSMADSYQFIGSILYHQNDYSKALDYINNAINIYKMVYGPEDLRIASCYNSVGVIYKVQGDKQNALDYYKKCLVIYDKKIGINHPAVASTCGNIGMLLYDLGDTKEALNYCNKALEINLDVFGSNHPNTADSYNYIGLIYRDNDYLKSLNYYTKALEIRERVFGTNHPEVATSYSNIGELYSIQGYYNEALEYLYKALSIEKQGADHLCIAKTFTRIAVVYDKQGDYQKAIEYAEKALIIATDIWGIDNPQTEPYITDVEYIKAKIKESER